MSKNAHFMIGGQWATPMSSLMVYKNATTIQIVSPGTFISKISTPIWDNLSFFKIAQ